MSDIIDQYGNIVLIPWLSVLHEDRVKTLLSQQFSQLLCYYCAMSILDTCTRGRQQISFLRIRKTKYD